MREEDSVPKLEDRDLIKRMLLKTVGRSFRKPRTELVGEVLAHLRFINICVEDCAQLMEVLGKFANFPSFPIVKKECDKIMQRRLLYGKSTALTQMPKQIVPGTPPSWEALFVMIKKEKSDDVFRQAFQRKIEKGFSEATIWKAYDRWFNGEVLEDILK